MRSGTRLPAGTGTVATTSDTWVYAYRFQGPTCQASAGICIYGIVVELSRPHRLGG